MCGHLIGGVAEVAWHRMVWSLPKRKVIRFFPICVACRHDVRFVLALAITRGGQRNIMASRVIILTGASRGTTTDH